MIYLRHKETGVIKLFTSVKIKDIIDYDTMNEMQMAQLANKLITENKQQAQDLHELYNELKNIV